MVRRVAIIGGGLAGLAVASRLCEQPDLRLTLFEHRSMLGGRASSFYDPAADECVDYCQHVGMGCCTNLQDFCRLTGIHISLTRHRKIPFFGPEGDGPYWLHASPGLPPPLHLAPSLARMAFLSRMDRAKIAMALIALARRKPARKDELCLDWLRRKGQSDESIRKFWSVVLVSALGESLERVSVDAARKVFVDGFLRHRDAYAIDVPRLPWGTLLDKQVADWLGQHQVELCRAVRVREVQTLNEVDAGSSERPRFSLTLEEAGESLTRDFAFVVTATTWRQTAQLLGPDLCGKIPGVAEAARFAASPITGVHLWFQRQIISLPFAVLVDRLTQWVFRRDDSEEGKKNEQSSSPTSSKSTQGQYLQVVISASRNLAGRDREDLLAEILSDLRLIAPAAERDILSNYRFVTQPHAVFSYEPDLDAHRPPATTAVPGLFLAGDWTATGWPATMEGAVRSGYLAAEGVLRDLGQPRNLLVPDLRAGLLARCLGAEER